GSWQGRAPLATSDACPTLPYFRLLPSCHVGPWGSREAEMAAVLVVDDYDAGGELLARLLRRRGHEAKHVASGREALGAMSESRYDLVVLDYMMPGMDGADVLRAMAGHPTTAAVPVVVLTAAADPAVDDRVRRLGAPDC